MTYQNRIADALTRMRSQRGISVTVTQAGVNYDAVAVVGKTTATQDVASDGGTVIRVPTRDYLIRASDIPEPVDGMRIEEPDGSIHEARPIGAEPCWRWHDMARTHYRIHTIEVQS